MPRDEHAPRRRWLLPVIALAVAACAAAIGFRVAATLMPPEAARGEPAPAKGSFAAANAMPAAINVSAEATTAGGPGDYPGFTGSVVRFASVSEGQAVVGADDDWIAATSEMQRASLMRVPPAQATRDAFRRFQAAQVVAWSDAAKQRYRRALEQVAPAFNRLGLRLPPEVLIVQSNGRESAATPHTRGRAIVFPLRFDQQSFADAELVAHELWHVISRHQPALRTRLYRRIGYVPTAPLEWPPGWKAQRLTNQDAPHHEHLMWVDIGGRPVALMPLVVVDPGELKNGGTIVTAAETRLVEVIPGSNGQPTRVVTNGKGAPVWHDPDQTPAYLSKLGGNSDYLVHPEETMADNIMFLASGRQVPNPALLKSIAEAITER